MNKTKKKLLLISLFIIGIDFLTKIIALNLLPFQDYVNVIGERVNFYLTYNMNSTGGQAGYLLRHENNKNAFLLISSISMIFLTTYIIRISKTAIKKKYKWFIGFGIYILMLIIIMMFKKQFSDLVISNWTTSMFTKIVGISFYSTIFYFTKNNTIRFFTIFIISSGIGNLISHFYYPYRVIDFIDIEGSYELFKIGVSNLADFAFDIGFCGLLITLVVLTAKKIINHFKLHKNK